jgi:hypothetical protein
MCSHIECMLTALPWRRNRLLFSRSFLVTHCASENLNTLRNLLGLYCLYDYFPEHIICTVLFTEMVSTIYWSVIKKSRKLPFSFGEVYIWPLFLNIEFLYSTNIDVCWISAWASNLSKIRPTVQALTRDVHIQAVGIPKAAFPIFRAAKNWFLSLSPCSLMYSLYHRRMLENKI